MIEPLCQMHVFCEWQRVCCEFFGALKLLCASAALVSHLVPILIAANPLWPILSYLASIS